MREWPSHSQEAVNPSPGRFASVKEECGLETLLMENKMTLHGLLLEDCLHQDFFFASVKCKITTWTSM
eukprot:5257487-Prorocentrum_lima.AAC.1